MWSEMTFFGRTWFWISFALVTLGGVLSIGWAGGLASVEIVKALAWPFVIVAVVALFAFHPRLSRIFGLAKVVRKIGAAGIEMEISADAVDQVRDQLRSSISELIENAENEYVRMAEMMRIYEHLERVVREALPRVLQRNGLASVRDIRGTVHIQDIVFSEYLYQIVDYYPPSGGSGRRFPQRYGMIGRSWRLGESLGEGNAFEGGKGEERTLIVEWGMVRKEVQADTRKRSAYLAVILRGIEDEGFPIGVFFADTGAENAFGDDATATNVALELEKSAEVQALARALERALMPLRLAAPNVDIRSSFRR